MARFPLCVASLFSLERPVKKADVSRLEDMLSFYQKGELTPDKKICAPQGNFKRVPTWLIILVTIESTVH